MYNKHFGLKHTPFSIAPDPRYLFMSERHREALAHLLYGLQGSGGVVLLTGEIGAGKTTVCRCFLEQIPKKCNVAYIFNPKLTVPELLRTVCDEFGIPVDHIRAQAEATKEHVDAINAFLLRTHAVGQNNVLIIDEAQNLSVDVLEQLRLLTNLETTERKLLQIILIGQPELRDMLAQPQLEQLAQRVTARYHLEALDEVETSKYMHHRLAVAGRTGGMPFDQEARHRVFALSRGIPRRINLLCDRAMLGTYATGAQRITAATVNQSAEEVFGKAPAGAAQAAWVARWPWMGAGVLGGGLLVAFALAGLQEQHTPEPQSATADVVTPPVVPTASPATAPPAATLQRVTIDTSTPPQTIKPLQDEQQAWRLLALTSKITLADGDPCAAAGQQRLACVKRNDGNVAMLKQLRKPALLTLQDAQGLKGYVVYTGSADASSLTLRGAGGEVVKLEASAFAKHWNGAFATFQTMAAASTKQP